MKFLVRTDHGALSWLLRFKNPEGQIARWFEVLNPEGQIARWLEVLNPEGQIARWFEVLNTYNFEIQHRAGKQHGNADGLSRRPCISCKYCTKQEQKDSDDDIDESREPCPKIHALKSIEDDTDNVSIGWLQSKSKSEIKEAQVNDENLSIIHNMKSCLSNRPSWKDVSIENTVVKKYWSQWDRIVIEDNILYRKWVNSNSGDSILQLLIPNIWKSEVIELMHDNPLSGHLGITRTITRVQNRFYWVGYKEDISNWPRN